MTARHPAAFINEIAENGSKAEAITHLQTVWDDYQDLQARHHAATYVAAKDSVNAQNGQSVKAGHFLKHALDPMGPWQTERGMGMRAAVDLVRDMLKEREEFQKRDRDLCELVRDILALGFTVEVLERARTLVGDST